jgi:hypothetical protein
MIKKKAKKKAAKGAAAKKSGKRSKSKKELDAAQVRKEIAGMVKANARDMAESVIDKTIANGELAPAKYFLEMAGVYPAATDGGEGSEEEDCLAKTLLDRLGLPTEPIIREEDQEEMMIREAVRAREAAEAAAAGEETEASDVENTEEVVS